MRFLSNLDKIMQYGLYKILSKMNWIKCKKVILCKNCKQYRIKQKIMSRKTINYLIIIRNINKKVSNMKVYMKMTSKNIII